tara:strand:+ start:1553 stop:2371 length:819 start_codon:yes stop_codon:yes gene_type:complete
MKTKLINGLSEIYNKYDTFLIDLWGVIHNGIKPYPEALEVLKNLKKVNKKFIFISNAPRPSINVKNFLIKLKMDKDLLDNVFTSGEAALQALKKNIYGKNFFHLGPKRDEDLIEEFKKNKTGIEDCDFIVCTGLFEYKENELNYYKNLLKNYTNIKMVCTNPDLIVHRGKKKEYCAGSVAEVFKDLGGQVIYFGKPYPEIYNYCIKKNETILAIGDNIRTDIMGANNMKFDSLFIIDGIHQNEFIDISKEKYDKILEKYKVKTNYYQKKLSW